MREIRVALEDGRKPERRSWLERNPIFASFLLTTIVGSGITLFYQYLEERFQKEAEGRRIQRSSAREMLVTFSELAERRNYYAFRILGALDDVATKTNAALAKELLKADREKYRSAVEEWNIKRNYYERFIAFYLGEDSRRQFYNSGNSGNIVEEFVTLHRLVVTQLNIYDANGITDHEALEKGRIMREHLARSLADLYDELIRYGAGVEPNQSPEPAPANAASSARESLLRP